MKNLLSLLGIKFQGRPPHENFNISCDPDKFGFLRCDAIRQCFAPCGDEWNISLRRKWIP